MVVLKKVGILSMAKIQAILMLIIGLFLGIIYAILATTVDASQYSASPIVILGWWSILVIPVIYGVLGFIIGVIGAWLYNIVAKKVGGIEVELSK
ncbi:MAG: DUF3566 domain-containing protein [Nanobdellota archaeon]